MFRNFSSVNGLFAKYSIEIIKKLDSFSNTLIRFIILNSNLCRIFRLRGVQKMWGGPIFRGWNEFLLLGKALKFGVIFQKYALKFINN